MVAKLVDDLTTDTTKGLSMVMKEVNAELHFHPGINLCRDMLRPRLELEISRNCTPAKGGSKSAKVCSGRNLIALAKFFAVKRCLQGQLRSCVI